MLSADGVAVILFAALVLDGLIGDPDWLWRRAPHPAVLMGKLIGLLDKSLNKPESSPGLRRGLGVVALAAVVAVTGAAGVALHRVFATLPFGWILEAATVAILLAQRSLHEHVARVRNAFSEGGLDAARHSISMIVGRDPKSLDEAGICRAAIETTAENFSDGVIAPAFWYLVAGLPGILIYKAVNTVDSMIGHRTARHVAFGWASARLDDVLNLIPARLSGVLLVAAASLLGGKAGDAWRAMMRDARRHSSPNAGWPEAAMGGALGIALAGPRRYGGETVYGAWMNEGGRENAAPADVARALQLFRAACILFGACVAALAVAGV